MQAILLVGGKGTRLRSVESDKPKSMVLIGEYPFLKYLIVWLVHWGVDEIVLCAGYMAEYIHANLSNLAAEGAALKLLVEEIPLGTGGALKYAKPFTEETFLVLNGDTFCDIDLSELIAQHRTNSALATLALLSVDDASGRGVVEIGETGRLIRFAEKAIEGDSGLVNGGIYVIERELLAHIPTGRFVSIEKEIFPALVEAGRISGVVFHSDIIDIGTPAGLNEARKRLPKLFSDRGWL